MPKFCLPNRVPAHAVIRSVLNSNKNKAFYADELYKTALKLYPQITYSAIISSLDRFDSVKLYGDYRNVYAHEKLLEKIMRSEKTSNLLNKYVSTPASMLIFKLFEKNKNTIYTPVEVYKQLKKNGCNVNYSCVKGALVIHFPRLALSKRSTYYGHIKVLKKYERQLEKNGILCNFIKPKKEDERTCQI